MTPQNGTFITVEFGHNDYTTTNKNCKIAWSQMVIYYMNLHSYNDFTVITEEFIIT